MPLRTVLLLVLLAAIALFAVLNWNAFTAPTPLSLGVATVEAPLGLILLALIALMAAVFLAYAVYLQTSFLVEARRNARELQAQRELADQAEASRFTELRAHVDTRFTEIENLRAYLDTRLTEIENSISAQLGEMRGSMQGSMQGSMPASMRDRADR